jgi:hypothetical protein
MTCWLCGCKTTQLATNADTPTCNNGPCQICIKVAQVDEEIEQAEATLRGLLAKRSDLRSEQNRAHDLMHRFPVELKNHIFEFFLPSRDKWGRRKRGSRTLIPLYLTSICRGWRDIAWSNPLLWSTIHVVLGSGKRSTADLSSRINFVQDWILRSRTLPLTLHIASYDTVAAEEEAKAVFDTISQSSNRWHSLSLCLPMTLFRDLQRINLQCHLLRRLRIVASRRRGEEVGQPVQFLNPTARPEDIEVLGMPLHSLQTSWNHLSSANVGYLPLDDVMQIFQLAPQMTYCHILTANLPRNPSISPIVHQRLTTLGLCPKQQQSVDVAAMLLENLTLPSLQKFITHGMSLLAPAYLPVLVHRSSCPLTSITVLELPTGILGTFNNLQPFRGVTDLSLHSVDGAVKRFLVQEYFPDLRCLTLRVQPFLFLWRSGIISTLLGRKRPNAPNEARLPKLFVVDETSRLDYMWDSDIGKSLAVTLNINFMQGGFEIL